MCNRFSSETYAAEWISSLRNGMLKNCVFGTYRAAATEASVQACNNDDTGADTFLNPLTWPFLAAAQTAEAWMNAGSEALVIGNALKKSGQLLTLALRQRCAE